MTLIDQGLSNMEIAGRLVTQVATVKNLTYNVLEKLGAHTLADEVAARVQSWQARLVGHQLRA